MKLRVVFLEDTEWAVERLANIRAFWKGIPLEFEIIEPTHVFFNRPLGPGNRGLDVKVLQQLLLERGILIPDGATGYFGKQTRAAVARFQQEIGIAAAPSSSGYFGPKSQKVFKMIYNPVPMSPFGDVLAVLHPYVVERWDANYPIMIVAPTQTPPRDLYRQPLTWQEDPKTLGFMQHAIVCGDRHEKGVTFYGPQAAAKNERMSVAGLFLPDREALEVFSTKDSKTYATTPDGVFRDLGDTFSVFVNHELSHYFYMNVLKHTDMTHQYFYSGQPERARDEIVAFLSR